MLEAEKMETNEMNLTDFPNELLIQIFCHLNDTSLLDVRHVCKRFKALTEISVAQKYNGTSQKNYYALNVQSENFAEENKQYFPFIYNLGKNVGAISIKFSMYGEVAKNHWLILLIQRYFNLVKKVKIEYGENVDLANIIGRMTELQHLNLDDLTLLNSRWTEFTFPKLEYFSALRVKGINRQNFATFVKLNQELKYLKLVGADFSSYSDILKIKSLETLKLGIYSNLVPALSSVRSGCKNIEHLTICNDENICNIRDIEVLCTFSTLKTLQIYSFHLTFKLFKKLIRGLPNLVSFSLGEADKIYETEDDLLSVVQICQKLSSLELTVFLLRISNFDFYKRFADITTSMGSNLKLELCNDDTSDKIILTKEEARLIHESNRESVFWHCILYWKGYDPSYNLSGKNLLQLDEKVLLKILCLLDGNALYAFYQTCNQAQQLVIEHLSQSVLNTSFDPSYHIERLELINENVFRNLGKFIYRLKLNLDNWLFDGAGEEAAHEEKVMKYLKDVNKYCKRLCELEIKGEVYRYLRSTLSWPNLKKINLRGVNNQALQMFHCAKLTVLEIQFYEEVVSNVHFDCAESFCNLTSLKFQYYDQHVENFLYGLNRTICVQLKDLSLSCQDFRYEKWFQKNLHLRWMILINIIKRFRHLLTLHLHIRGIEESNTKFLFENCSKLTELSLIVADYVCEETFLRMLSNVEQNCKYMDVIQLYRKGWTFPSFLDKINILFRKTKTKIKLTQTNW